MTVIPSVLIASMLKLMVLMVSMPRMLTTKVQTVMQSMVPKTDTVSPDPSMSLGASLRDRATLSSPLRGLAPSGGYPSRLRSLRSLRAPLARQLAALVADLASLALAGCAGCGHRHGSSRCTPYVAGCRLRRTPARALPAAPLAALVRALLRSAPALRSAARRALVSAPVRTLPPAPPAACCARLPAAPSAPPATQSPWRLPSAGFAGVDSPFAHAARRAVPDRPGRLWVSHPTQLAARHAMGIRVRALQGLSAPLGAWRLLERACNAPNSSAFRLLSPHACPRR